MSVFTYLQQRLFSKKIEASFTPYQNTLPTHIAVSAMADNSSSYTSEVYTTNDIVYAAINIIMDRAKSAPWQLYKVADEDSYKSYTSLKAARGKTFTELSDLHCKALKPLISSTNTTSKYKDLLLQPNDFETFQQFVANGIGWKLLTGNKIIQADLYDSGASTNIPYRLSLLPVDKIGVKFKSTYPLTVDSYQINSGVSQNIANERILHEKFWNPNFDFVGNGFFGQSPLAALRGRIKRNNEMKKASEWALKNNGVSDIVYYNDPLLPATARLEQAKMMKDKLQESYTGIDRLGSRAVSGYSVGAVKLGYPLKDMDLKEVEYMDVRMVCSVLGIPSKVLNDPENSAQANTVELEKALISRGVLPHLLAMGESFNGKAHTHWGLPKDIIIDFDPGVYRELQDDQSKKWQWVSQLPITNRRKLEMMGEDVPDVEGMEDVLVPSNYVNIKSLSVADINSLLDGV